MSFHYSRRRWRAGRGSSLIEFAIIAVLLMLILFASIEFGRMLLVYTSVANSARVGCRYAITHGSDNPANIAAIQTVVKNFAASAPLNTANLTITVTYPDAATTPGSRVDVKVVYPYDPFTILPLNVNLGSVSEGIITF
ncbi:MAG: TadE/TadG family type IV pilus assembly protein [Bryobacteraceae bacterium]